MLTEAETICTAENAKQGQSLQAEGPETSWKT